jgi:hypothetical protein
MEARGQEGSQSRRSSVKRPWEDDSSPQERRDTWQFPLAPLAGTTPARSRALDRQSEKPGDTGTSRYGLNSEELTNKRPKFEPQTYTIWPQRGVNSTSAVASTQVPSRLAKTQMSESDSQRLTIPFAQVSFMVKIRTLLDHHHFYLEQHQRDLQIHTMPLTYAADAKEQIPRDEILSPLVAQNLVKIASGILTCTGSHKKPQHG